MESLPLDAGFGLETVPTSARPARALAVVRVRIKGEGARDHHLRVHRLQAAVATAPATVAAAAWTAAHKVEAVAGAAPPTTAALGSWVAVPCGHAAAFLPVNEGADDRYYHLWNAATDTLLLPGGEEGDEGPRGKRAVVAMNPAVEASAGKRGGWAWRPLARGDGAAGRLVWVEDGVEWTLGYQEQEGLGWCLERNTKDGPALGMDLVCRRREWMGHDQQTDEHDNSSPPFKLVNAASLRALCTCGGSSSSTAPCVCRRHLSDDRKWAYRPATQALVEVTSGRGLHVTCAKRGYQVVIEHALSEAPAAHGRWVYDADAALLLFPAALAALAADLEGRWEEPLSLLHGRPLDEEEEAPAAAAAAAVQRLRWHPERHALPLPSCFAAPLPAADGAEPPPPPSWRAAALSRDAVAGLGLLRFRPAGELRLLAEGGEARLYVSGGEGEEELVCKAYHRHAMGKALKELQALLAVRAHAPRDSALVGLRGVEWPVDGARPTALLLERAAADLRTMLLNAQHQQQRQPLPLRQVLMLALGLATAVERLHGAGLCHKDIHSGNILIRRIDSTNGFGLDDIALADLGLAAAWTPLRAALDMRAIALVLLEASWDGERRRHDGNRNDEGGGAGPEPWPPSRITAKSLLDHADPRFLALSDLPPSHAAVLGPGLRGCFGEGGRQLTPLGLTTQARRLLQQGDAAES